MNRKLCILVTWLCPVVGFAAPYVCAQDQDTDKVMCFPNGPIRASTNGNIRQVALYTGGPKSIKNSTYSARVLCKSSLGSVMELRDSSGVVFARQTTDKKFGRDFARFVCEHKQVKIDKSLD